MSARILALAGGAIVAMLAAPVAADECSDYRAAFALHETRALEQAVPALRRTLRDKAAIDTVEAIDAAMDKILLAMDHKGKWQAPRSRIRLRAWLESGHLSDLASVEPHSGALSVKLLEALEAASAAYHDALHLVCFERDAN